MTFTRERTLYLLLQHGPLTRRQLLAVTGWKARRLERGLELATRPRGSVVATYEREPHCYVFRAKTREELQRRPPKASARSDPWG